jgi:hypothetical protein
MSNQLTQQTVNLLGLLECPLRRGYIEFEYQQGDLISELRARVIEVWGDPKAVSDRQRQGRRSFGLWDAGVWAILCQDETGAYIALRDTDQIPVKPPPSGETLEALLNRSRREREDFDFLEGVIHEGDVYASDERQRHISLNRRKQYKPIIRRTYSVRLLALVVVAGG